MIKSYPRISVHYCRDHLPYWVLIVKNLSKGIVLVN